MPNITNTKREWATVCEVLMEQGDALPVGPDQEFYDLSDRIEDHAVDMTGNEDVLLGIKLSDHEAELVRKAQSLR